MNHKLPDSIHLKVVMPHKVLVDMEVDEISLPSLEGELGVLPGHQNLVVALSKGKLCYKRNNKEDCFFVNGGYAEVRPDSVIVVTEHGDYDDEAQRPAKG